MSLTIKFAYKSSHSYISTYTAAKESLGCWRAIFPKIESGPPRLNQIIPKTYVKSIKTTQIEILHFVAKSR